MAVRLEHANLIVRGIEGMIRFLQTEFPEFRVRGEGKTCPPPGASISVETRKIDDHGEAVHEGCSVSTVALNVDSAQQERAPERIVEQCIAAGSGGGRADVGRAKSWLTLLCGLVTT
jgi:hypothetical protein